MEETTLVYMYTLFYTCSTCIRSISILIFVYFNKTQCHCLAFRSHMLRWAGRTSERPFWVSRNKIEYTQLQHVMWSKV